jgi:hypothetical protein
MQKIDSLEDRRKTAAEAKARLLDRFKARPAADDPAMIARAAERRAIEEAREARQAEKARERQAREEEQRAVEAAAAAEAERIANADRLQREAADRDRAARVMADEATRKAQRDARYAARKARKS